MLPRPGCRMGVKENKTKVQARAKLVYSLSRPSSAYQGESRQVDSYGVRSVLPRVLAIRVTCGGAGGLFGPSPRPLFVLHLQPTANKRRGAVWPLFM